MRYPWDLPEQWSLANQAPRWHPKRVLIEYDGPQLVTLAWLREEYLALAVDDDEQCTRWIMSPVSKLEYEGLIRGGASVRSVLAKPTVKIVDYTHRGQGAIRVWDVDVSLVPETTLPERGAPLPDGVRHHLAKAVAARPSFDIGGGSDRVPFGALSAITGKIQMLWNAFARDLQFDHLTLAAVAFARGSLRVNVHTDNAQLFGTIAERYKELTFATDDSVALQRALKREPEGVAIAYGEYLKAVDLQRVEVLAQWAGNAAFVGHSAAKLTRRAAAGYAGQQSGETTKATEHFRGHFEDMWRIGRSGKFAFYDIDTGETYIGGIDPTLRRRILSPEFRMTLGRSTQLYAVDILVERRDGQASKYTLQRFQAASE